VKKALDAGKGLAEVAASIDMPWYKDWTGKAAKENKDNVEHVMKELTGKVDHERLGRRPDSPLDWPADGRAAAVLAAGSRGGR
jgi:hypothetical protein